MNRILVVEDSSDILFILQSELEYMGYVVDVAEDANKGLEIARRGQPDVIVSDLLMPGMDGFEFIRCIRKLQHLSEVPAIAMTGFSEQKELQRALALGFTAHLTKPVEPVHLASLIQRLTAKRFQFKAS